MAPLFALEERLGSELKNIPAIVDRAYRAVLEITSSEDEAFRVKLVLEEALSNAMRHGNGLDASRQVTVTATADRAGIRLDVHDQGGGFEVSGLPDPTAGDRVNRPSGRGVFLMKKMMDSVTFYDNGRGVVLERSFAAR